LIAVIVIIVCLCKRCKRRRRQKLVCENNRMNISTFFYIFVENKCKRILFLSDWVTEELQLIFGKDLSFFIIITYSYNYLDHRKEIKQLTKFVWNMVSTNPLPFIHILIYTFSYL
jgi:hypothetical protein